MLIVVAAGCAGAPPLQLSDADRALQPSGSLEGGERVIRLQARQFEFDPDPMVVRAGERVRIEATSLDVEHGLAIPGYRINRQIPPGSREVITFTADQEGVYPTHCSVFCGWGHMHMSGRLIVLPAAR
jgi:cytochrome c oxidase subunit 2